MVTIAGKVISAPLALIIWKVVPATGDRILETDISPPFGFGNNAMLPAELVVPTLPIRKQIQYYVSFEIYSLYPSSTHLHPITYEEVNSHV